MRTLLAIFLAIPLLLGAPDLADAAGKKKDKGKGGPTPTQGQGKSGDIATDQLLGTIISATEPARGSTVRCRSRRSGATPTTSSIRRARTRKPPGRCETSTTS